MNFKSSTWGRCILCFWLRSFSTSNYACTTLCLHVLVTHVISTNISSWRKILESADNIIFLVIVDFEYAFISFHVTRKRKRIITINIYSGINAFYNSFFVSWRRCKWLERTSPLFPSPTSISLPSAFSLPSLFLAFTSSTPSAKSNDKCFM